MTVARIIEELGPWLWWVLGLALFGAEIVLPGMFLLWIGLAALSVGAISLLWWSSPTWDWQSQLILFALLSVLLSLAGRRIMGSQKTQIAQALAGRTGVLSEPIVAGRGRLRLDEAWWIVSGPDLPEGTRVRIVGSVDGRLTVEPA